MTHAYYNEVEPYAAQWIRNLIAAGLVATGDVDTRSIVDVHPADLRGFTRCHFFAGIAVWDYALGLAGWPDDREIWTGSCPCQPFSTAGKGAGFADERHLWPAWFHLIRECRPSKIVGEQVASSDGLDWLDLVHADLDGIGYAFGAADLCAAGIGAPHIRQRLWFLADAGLPSATRLREHRWTGATAARLRDGSSNRRFPGVVAYAPGERRNGGELTGAPSSSPARRTEEEGRRPTGLREPAGRSATVYLGDTGEQRLSHAELEGLLGTGRGRQRAAAQQSGRTFWSDPDWLFCRDGKWRPVEPGTFPLVASAPARMGRLRAYGNAINAEAARTFIECVMEARP